METCIEIKENGLNNELFKNKMTENNVKYLNELNWEWK